jgi:hypothetical protein
MALGRLLAHVPVRVTWFVGMGRPVELLGGAARVWKLLAEIPDLTAPMSLVAERLKKAMAAWPPTAAQWTDLGIDPGGGVVLAGVGARSNRPGGTLALAYTMTPQRLLKRLVGPAGVASGSMAQAVLQGAGAWWCGPVSVGVACASSRALLTESVAQGSKGRAQTLLAKLAVDRWQSVDLVGGWRSQAAGPITMGVLRLGSRQISARVWLRDRELDRWLGWIGQSKKIRPRAADAVASVWLNLDKTRISTLVGLLPADAIESTGPSTPAPAALLKQCTGEAMLELGPWGWLLRATRSSTHSSPGSSLGSHDRPVGWKVSGWPVWVRAPAGSLIIARSKKGTRRAAAGAQAKAKTKGSPPSHRALLSRPVGLALLVPGLDPLEAVSAADRVRLVAAIAGLPAGERALVGLVRGLFTLLGEAVVTVEKTPRGPEVRVSFVPPMSGSADLRRDFRQLWRGKWQGGGFFHRRGLARVAARHGSTPLARLARALMGLELGPPWSRWLTDSLLGLLRSLSGPELSCATLAARLLRCQEPFARQRSPGRWRELDRVVLPGYRRRLQRVLLDSARREREALGAHCDRLSGRLENVREVSACLAADDCVKFSQCLVQAFTPKK